MMRERGRGGDILKEFCHYSSVSINCCHMKGCVCPNYCMCIDITPHPTTKTKKSIKILSGDDMRGGK